MDIRIAYSVQKRFFDLQLAGGARMSFKDGRSILLTLKRTRAFIKSQRASLR